MRSFCSSPQPCLPRSPGGIKYAWGECGKQMSLGHSENAHLLMSEYLVMVFPEGPYLIIGPDQQLISGVPFRCSFSLYLHGSLCHSNNPGMPGHETFVTCSKAGSARKLDIRIISMPRLPGRETNSNFHQRHFVQPSRVPGPGARAGAARGPFRCLLGRCSFVAPFVFL